MRLPYMLLLFWGFTALTATGQTENNSILKRRGFLGVQVKAITGDALPESVPGVEVVYVFDKSTARAAGLLKGDIIHSVNGYPIKAPADLVSSTASIKSGDKMRLLIKRNGSQQEIHTVAEALPKEEFKNAEVIHGTVKTEAGLLRSIFTLPAGRKHPPVVFILQGFDCSSIEKPLTREDAYIRLINMLTQNGFATYRLEKSNTGDSEGLPCPEIGFDLETKGFIDGLNTLSQSALINNKEIYLLGISLGGIWAPILANQLPVKGIISYGTISKTWQEYSNENSRRQWLLAGMRYPEIETNLELVNIFWNELFTSGKDPALIFREHPALTRVASHLTIDPAKEQYAQLYGRHYSFVKELDRLNIAEQWEKISCNTLLLWGRGDYIASEEDQLLIRDILQKRNKPVELLYVNADHYWRQSASFIESYTNLRQGKAPAFQEDILTAIKNWLLKA